MGEDKSKEKEKEKDMEGNGFSSLLVEGRFEECLTACSGFLTAKTDVSKARGLRPSIEFKSNLNNIPNRFKVCLTFLQCIYEVGEDRGGPFVQELESFFAQNSPIPYLVARTWIQLKLKFHEYESAKELLLAYLGALAEAASKEDNEGSSFSIEKQNMYAELANLYIVYTLPALDQLAVAHKFLNMHNNSTLLTPEQRNYIHAALDKISSPKSGTSRAVTDTSDTPNVSSDSPNADVNHTLPQPPTGTLSDNTSSPPTTVTPNNRNSATEPSEEGSKILQDRDNGKIVISVEQAVGATAAFCVFFGVIANRHSIGNFAKKTAKVVGDTIFGSG